MLHERTQPDRPLGMRWHADRSLWRDTAIVTVATTLGITVVTTNHWHQKLPQSNMKHGAIAGGGSTCAHTSNDLPIHRILVVDDDRLTRQMVRDLLEGADFAGALCRGGSGMPHETLPTGRFAGRSQCDVARSGRSG